MRNVKRFDWSNFYETLIFILMLQNLMHTASHIERNDILISTTKDYSLVGEILKKEKYFLPQNLSLKKKTVQSDAFYNSYSGRAVDGNQDSSYFGGSCTYSGVKNEDSFWWSVDLGGNYIVRKIRIWNRRDCCSERLKGAEVHVTTAPFNPSIHNQSDQCGPPIDQAETKYSINCGAMLGRHVTISSRHKHSFVICEVSVLGYSPCDFCDAQAMCIISNTNIADTCKCKVGYVGNGYSCQRIVKSLPDSLRKNVVLPFWLILAICCIVMLCGSIVIGICYFFFNSLRT